MDPTEMNDRIFRYKHAPIQAVLILVMAMMMLACDAKNNPSAQKSASPGKPAPRAVPVMTAGAVTKTIPVEIRAIGNVESASTVAIKSRVTGELRDIHFREGQDVKKGDLLFTIDPRTFQAGLREARARLEKDRALTAKAVEDLRRYEVLIQKQFISQEAYEQVKASLDALEATVAADEAVVENAALQLGFTSIVSPISGRTGAILITAGNMIKANDDNNALVVIQQVQPIYVSFSVPENHLSEINRRIRKEAPAVQVAINGSSTFSETGRLTFVDNAVDSRTGTIRLKAVFDNSSRQLWPGQFVDVILILGNLQDAVLVPSQAVQTGASGPFAYVISASQTAEFREIRVGPAFNGETVIKNGIQSGETVVVDGHLRLTPGVSVDIKNIPASTPPLTVKPSG
ncbi:MAG: efflux RND transporter periplasmic adaptor subunit [Desulfatirhabdiaceae bacterium]